MTAAVRERPPNRRPCTSFTFSHGGTEYLASVSYYGDGRLAEVFVDVAKPGSALAEHANDAAILASLLLQHGLTAAAIKHSITGPLSTALALAERES
jgi:hypothetical protein